MKKGYEILAIMPAFAEAYQEAMAKLDAYSSSERMQPDEEIEEIPEFLAKQDSVGVVSIKGKLSNTNSPWAKFFGLAPYNDVREALVYAATDESIESILLDIDSPGGTLAGMTETADLITTVGKIKPVKAYSSGTMASAAYALGSRADTISISDTAMAGSIGTILSLMTYEKHLEEKGITPHIIRSGKFKAVGGPMEKLTDESKAYLQEQIDYTANIFLGSVIKERSLDMEGISDIQSGKEFIGKKAVSVGLVDTIESFDDVMSGLLSSHEGDGMKKGYKKEALTAQQIAALASGAQILADGESTSELSAEEQAKLDAEVLVRKTELKVKANAEESELTAEEQTELDAIIAKEQTELDAATAARKAELEAKDELSAEEQIELDAMTEGDDGSSADAGDAGDGEELSAGATSQDALVTYLKDQLAAKDTEISDLKAQVITSEASDSDMTALKAIAVDATAKMRIALTLSAVDMAEWKVDAILVEHGNVQKSFNEAFKIGGVTRVLQNPDKEVKKATVTRLEDARVKSVGI